MPMLKLDNDVNLYYSINGKGTPIVFIHPPVITSVNFTYQMEELSKHFQIITFDIRGHGLSDFSKSPLTYPLIAKDIQALLDHLQIEKAYICGYSSGGSIVLEYLLTFPDRALGGILVSGMPDVNDEYLRKRISMAIKLAEAGAKKVLAWTISIGNANTKELFKIMFSEACKGDIRNMEQYFRYSLQYNCTNRLEEIPHPILLVYGNKDKPFHQYAQLLHEKLPNNVILFIEENHRIPTKAAKELNECIKQFCLSHHPNPDGNS
ncbi:alpha/beta hydrolase [Bacillus sp. JJ1532]|uniref:alpha/beta fold hydrolase n=1 Tax=Bacillus sp. JJ1532 TaxID=3122958 RepID=UPI003000BAA6